MFKQLALKYKIIRITILITIILIIALIIVLSVILSKKKPENKNNEEIPNTQKNLLSIEISKMPNKIRYKEGEIFDKSGMIINAIYDDNTETNIDNYNIDKNSPLSLYDSIITISYEGKETSLKIIIINEDGIEIHPNPSKEKYTLELLNGITRFEIEDSNVINWIISDEDTNNKIIENPCASGGKYVSGINENVKNESNLIFDLNLKFNSEIKMSISYSKNGKWKNYDIDISSVYIFLIDGNNEIEIDGERILTFQENNTEWQIIKYNSYTLPKGNHSISIKAFTNLEFGTPNIDYIDFRTIEIEEIPIEPDVDGKPSNDFHTLLQYKYILDENPENIFNYAKGTRDLSRPEGNILDFNDNMNISLDSYIIQISSSIFFNSSDTKIINNLNEKKYIFKNAKLGQSIYYRGGMDENGLISSRIYKLTINSLPPRNLDIPGVDNSRDIGGYKTSLVENATIKQGLYYRSAKIDYITEKGKKILKEHLGVKIELDLRPKEYNNGPYVDGVEYYAIPIPTGTKSTRFEEFEEEYVKVFNFISEADKKPIILHCTAGADRTGIMSFALLTFLGCEYNDIAKDYLFTNFGVQGKRDINSEFINWWNKLDNYEGDTKAEKSKNWLLSKGIEESKLEHIREIFIDGYKTNISLNSIKKENLNSNFIIRNSNAKIFEFFDIKKK